MARDDDPNEVRAKMLALLALLDVLDAGTANMSAVVIERVGRTGRYAGKVRLKFSVFVDESSTLAAADVLLANATSLRAIATRVEDRIRRGDLILFATQMIAAWTDLIARLARTPTLPAPDRDDLAAVHDALGPGPRRLPAGSP